MKNVKLYAYLDIDNPMVAWEVAIGRIRSVCDINVQGFGISLWQYNLLKRITINKDHQAVVNEFMLEKIRKEFYPENVSRLKGVYFFKSFDDATAAIDRWCIPKIKKKYISEVYFSATNMTEVDSEWITFNLSSKNDPEWMHSYWQGEIHGARPLSEVLASGIGVVQDQNLRSKAYENIFNLWPTSTLLLAAACCAFSPSIGCSLEGAALSLPAIVKKNDALLVRFYIFMDEIKDNQSKIASVMRKAKEIGQFPSVVLPDNPEHAFTVGDMSMYGFEITEKTVVNFINEIVNA